MRYFALHIILIAAAAVSAQVRSTMSGTDFLVGDYITIEQTAELRPGQEIMWPSAKVDDLNLEVIGEKFDTVASEITRTITYIQFDSGSYVYPARAIQVLESGDTTTVFETAAFPYKVAPVPLDTTGQVRAVKDILEVEYRPIPWKLIILGAVSILLLVGYLLYRKWAQRPKEEATEKLRPEPQKPIFEHSSERLAALEQKKLWQQEKVKEYYVEITDILREYLQIRFGIPVLERTTEEVADSLLISPIPGLPTANRDETIATLRLADMVKFAKARPLPDQHSACMQRAWSLLKATKPVEEVSAEEEETVSSPVDEPEKQLEQ